MLEAAVEVGGHSFRESERNVLVYSYMRSATVDVLMNIVIVGLNSTANYHKYCCPFATR